MAKPIYVEGEGGAQFEVDPDMPFVQEQLANGQLKRVQAPAKSKGKGAGTQSEGGDTGGDAGGPPEGESK